MEQASPAALELMEWEWETGQVRETVASKLMAIAMKESHAGGMVAGSRGAQGHCSKAECGESVVSSECDGKVLAMINTW